MSDLIDEFVAGDLLYGETCDREKYLPDLDLKFGQKRNSDSFEPLPKSPVTIDRLTNAYSYEKALKKGLAWSDDYRQGLLPEDAQLFYEFAQQSRFANKLKGVGTSNQTKSGVQKGQDPTKPYLRSKCKAGIEFVIQRGFTIRFVLDSLNEERLKKIFARAFDQPWYTGAELRSIYKNRDKYGDKVVFYRLGSRCKAPWDEFPAIIS